MPAMPGGAVGRSSRTPGSDDSSLWQGIWMTSVRPAGEDITGDAHPRPRRIHLAAIAAPPDRG